MDKEYDQARLEGARVRAAVPFWFLLNLACANEYKKSNTLDSLGSIVSLSKTERPGIIELGGAQPG